MTKLALVLALLANAVALTALLLKPSAPPPSAGSTVVGGALSDGDVRRLREEFERAQASRDAARTKELEARLQQLADLRATWTQSIQQAQRAAEGAARENAGKLEELDAQLASLNTKLEERSTELVALRASVTALEKRPVAVAPAPGPAPGPGTAGPRPAPVEPAPEVPATPAEDPALVKEKVDKALAELDQTDPEKLYPAIIVVQKYKALVAVPKLTKLLTPEPHPDVFTRQAAAAALGEMRACDAIPALAEAIVDKAVMVAQQANKSVRLITDLDTGMSPTARIVERRQVRAQVLEWWGRHEDEVRARYDQPKGGK